jgi:predicted nucleic acid-binding Zn ribbon protein
VGLSDDKRVLAGERQAFKKAFLLMLLLMILILGTAVVSRKDQE